MRNNTAVKTDENTVVVTFKRPIREEYHYSDKCAPKVNGQGCYGDCADCFGKATALFERYEWLARTSNTEA